MQTFLPCSSYIESAKCLDNKRLGKQRVETMQLLKALLLPSYSWAKHPAAKMWKGFEYSLIEYGQAICTEWIKRGFKDTCYKKITDMKSLISHDDYSHPVWLGDKDFHNSHKSNLLRKDNLFYSKYNWQVPDNLPYIWPINF